MSIRSLLDQEFGTIADLIRAQARDRPDQTALIEGEQRLSFAALDDQLDRVAAALQRDGVEPGATIAIGAANSIAYAVTFLGALRAGVTVAPLATSATAESVRAMLVDCAARLLFLDAAFAANLAALGLAGTSCCALDDSSGSSLSAWLPPPGTKPSPVAIRPDDAFNIIYSSGTTGTPKGIVQPHRMRWTHVRRGEDSGYGPDSVTIISTPLYSNTTLVSFFPGLALGGTVVLLAKFEPARFLAAAEKYRATHAMLVPVQYQRLLDHPTFDQYDLSSFRMKFCTSAPFSAGLKAQVLARWPGGLVEYYGMTEGGGTCALVAHQFPDKLHTVGTPLPGHDLRLIDERGRELAAGESGEVVGSSPALMAGYHNLPEHTRAAEWHDQTGKRFIRTGDIGRFDRDGFLILLDRKKDMIISGGFNIYPSDLEAVLLQHPGVAEAAVVGVPSARWGETPLACVVRRPACSDSAEQIRAWVDQRVGKTQRLSGLVLLDALPRSAIGKVLKRELRARYAPPDGHAPDT